MIGILIVLVVVGIVYLFSRPANPTDSDNEQFYNFHDDDDAYDPENLTSDERDKYYPDGW